MDLEDIEVGKLSTEALAGLMSEAQEFEDLANDEAEAIRLSFPNPNSDEAWDASQEKREAAMEQSRFAERIFEEMDKRDREAAEARGEMASW